MSEPRARPVLVLWTDGDVDVFDSPDGAARYLEPIDVANGEVAAIVDGAGSWCEAVVVRRGARVQPCAWVDEVRIRSVDRASDRDAERVLLEGLRGFVRHDGVGRSLESRGFAAKELAETNDLWQLVRALCSALGRTR
jgi:hypothetical protein